MRRLPLPALLILTLLTLAPAPPSAAQPAPAPVQLLADLNTATESSIFRNALTVGELAYFFIYDSAGGGITLWRSDGTATGTSIVHSFTGDSIDHDLVAIGTTLYFTTSESSATTTTGTLWRSDGSPAGTEPLRSFAFNAGIQGLTAAGGRLFFFVDSLLWTSDGSAAGTQTVKQLDLPFTQVHTLALGERLFFVPQQDQASNPTTQLWTSDGSAAGTFPLRDLSSQAEQHVSLRLLTAHQGGLIFEQRVGGISTIWHSDGTITGTAQVGPSLVGYTMLSVDSALYFTVDSQLWRGDGTPQGSALLFDLGALPQGQSYNAIYGLTTVGSALYFVASDSFGRGDLWRSDGSAAGTALVFSFGDRPYYQGLALLPAANAALYMFAYDTQHGYELWHSDGTAAGTALVADLTTSGTSSLSNLTQIIGADTQAFFTAQTGSASLSGSPDLWRSDGSAANTRLISSTIRIDAKAILGDRLIFTRTDQAGLWASDGTLEDIQQIAPQFSYLIGRGAGHIFIASRDYNTDQYAIIASDGTAGGSEMLFSIDQPIKLANADGGVYLLYAGNSGACRMRYSDGTLAGTGPVVPLPLNCENGFRGFAYLGQRLYMMVNNSYTSSAVWASDGSAAGTTPIISFSQELASYPTVIGDALLFISDSLYGQGFTLWRSDGRSEGTSAVLTLSKRYLYGRPILSGGKLFFMTWDKDQARWELWASDGSASGSVVLLTGATENDRPTISSLTAIGDLLLFAGEDGEPWLSDGTPVGTYRLHDVNPGVASANPFGFSLAGRRLFFAADDGTHGSEPWVSAPSLKLVGPAAVDAPAGLALIDLRAQEISLASGATVTLSITLDPALTYLGNDQGITPTQQGGALIFSWPVGAALRLSALGLRIGLPADAPTDKAYRVEIAATTSDPADEPADNQLSVALRRVYRLLAPIVAQ